MREKCGAFLSQINKTQKKQVPFFVRERETKIKHKKIPANARDCEFGAGNEARTRDPDLGKVVLYQLSYSRRELMLRMERETRLELATPTLARSCSTN